MARAVVDTNVIVSAVVKAGNPTKIWSIFKSGGLVFVLSSSMLMELNNVLQRKKFRKLIDEKERKELILYLELTAEFIEPSESVAICRDPADNHILACARQAKVNFIVTGDNDLLIIKSFHGIPILTPREFLSRIKKAQHFSINNN